MPNEFLEGLPQEPNIESEMPIEKELKVLEVFDWVDEGVKDENGVRSEKGIRGEKGEVYRGVIRYATRDDREGIKVVEKDKWDYRTKRGERDYRGAEPTMEKFDELINKPDKFIALVLTIDKQIIAHVDFGEDHLSEIPEATTTELYTVTTMEKYKRNGFMKKLLKLAEEEAQKVFGAEKIILSTQEENSEAIKFYSSFDVGYEQLPGHFESQGIWKGKSPYWSIHFIKHLKPNK